MDIKTRKAKTAKGRGVPIWELGYLEVVEGEARKFLNEDQYSHAIQLCEDLCYEQNPLESKTQDVQKIRDFYELRDKGGILGKINLRIYFDTFEETSKRKLILILAVYKKEDEGSPAQHLILRVQNRIRAAKAQLKKYK